MAYDFAKGGIDLIKDDHGLANQNYAPYEERVRACCAAVSIHALDTRPWHSASVPVQNILAF